MIAVEIVEVVEVITEVVTEEDLTKEEAVILFLKNQM